jgi:gas vesicle protein
MRFLVGFAFGALIGAGIAMLVGPRETSATDSVAELVTRGKAILEDARSSVDRAVSEGRRAADEQYQSLQSQITS